MCGIAGLFLPSKATAVEADLDAMLAAIRHRGPDSSARHVAADRRYQAGFARLAIIDLETGDQPIVEGDGERVLMGNGEVYNYIELRRAMAPDDYRYRSAGDMEVVLPLAARHGDDFVHRLNGMYALALYERQPHRLLLVRDRLGIKPLYWSRLGGGGVLFASEVKALFASGLVAPAVNEDAVSSYLAHGYVPAPATLFRGIRKLPPGHLLAADAGGEIVVRRYWRPAAAGNVPAGAGEIGAHLAELLRDSVRMQLRADVPVGALLSGGIDSGLAVAFAAEHSERPLSTYTVRFEGAAVDETPLAAQVAARYGTRHTVLEVPTGGIGGLLPKLAWYADEPLADASLVPNYLIEEALAGAVKVVLNGTGGDELFAGYGRYFQLPVERSYLRLPGWLRRRAVEPAVALLAPMTAWQLARAGKFAADRGGYLHDHSTLFPPPIRALIGNPLAPPGPAQAAAFAAFDGPADTGALAAELETYLPEDLLTLLDRTTMAVSVEGRVPFLDHRLVEAALAVPPEVRAPAGRQKALLRDIAARFLPADVVSAPKQGFASPVGSWMGAGLATLARAILTRRDALERGWWTATGIDRLIADPGRHAARLYALLMLELAVRIHVEGGWRVAQPTGGLEDFADAA